MLENLELNSQLFLCGPEAPRSTDMAGIAWLPRPSQGRRSQWELIAAFEAQRMFILFIHTGIPVFLNAGRL